MTWAREHDNEELSRLLQNAFEQSYEGFTKSSQEVHSHAPAEFGRSHSEIDPAMLDARLTDLIRKTSIGGRRFRELFMLRAPLRQKIASSQNASPWPEGED